MNLNQYREWTRTTAIYPQNNALHYLELGAKSEYGELCALYKRDVRDNVPADPHSILKELGDLLWYIVRYADETNTLITDEPLQFNKPRIHAFHMVGERTFELFNPQLLADDKIQNVIDWIRYFAATYGHTLSDVCAANVKKLESRKERNKLTGSGDNR